MTSNAAEDFARALTRLAVAKMCHNIGFHGAQATCLDVLSDLTRRYMERLFGDMRVYTDHGMLILNNLKAFKSRRVEPTPADLQAVFNRRQFCVAELNDYLQQIPEFPVRPAKPRRIFPAVSEKELAERPDYIPRHFPPLHPEWVAPDASPIVDETAAASLTNGFLPVDDQPNTSAAYEEQLKNATVAVKKPALPDFGDTDALGLGLLRIRSPIPQRPVTPVVIVPPKPLDSESSGETLKRLVPPTILLKTKKKHEAVPPTPALFSVDTLVVTKEKKKKKKSRSPMPDSALSMASTSTAEISMDSSGNIPLPSALATGEPVVNRPLVEKVKKLKLSKKGSLIEGISKNLAIKQKKVKEGRRLQALIGGGPLKNHDQNDQPAIRPSMVHPIKIEPLRLKHHEGTVILSTSTANEKKPSPISTIDSITAAREVTNDGTAITPPFRIPEPGEQSVSATPIAQSSPPKLKFRQLVAPNREKPHRHHRHKEKKQKREKDRIAEVPPQPRQPFETAAEQLTEIIPSAITPTVAANPTDDTRKIKMIFSVKHGKQAFSAFSKDSVPVTSAQQMIVNPAAFTAVPPSSPPIPPDANAETPPGKFKVNKKFNFPAFYDADGTPPFALRPDELVTEKPPNDPQPIERPPPEIVEDRPASAAKLKKAKKKDKDRHHHHKKIRRDDQAEEGKKISQRNGDAPESDSIVPTKIVPKLTIKMATSPRNVPPGETAAPIRLKIIREGIGSGTIADTVNNSSPMVVDHSALPAIPTAKGDSAPLVSVSLPQSNILNSSLGTPGTTPPPVLAIERSNEPAVNSTETPVVRTKAELKFLAKPKKAASTPLSQLVSASSRPSTPTVVSIGPRADSAPVTKAVHRNRVGRPPKKSKTNVKSSTEADNLLWICPVCSVAYVDGATDMIGCDACDKWFHWNCVGLVVAPPENRHWYCPNCAISHGGGALPDRLPAGRPPSTGRPASSASLLNGGGGRKRSVADSLSGDGRRSSSSASNHSAPPTKKKKQQQ